jgi:hypothetical protein
MIILHFILSIINNPIFISLLVIITSIFYYYLKNEKKSYRKVVWFAYLIIFTGLLVIFSKNEIYLSSHPRVWDFTAFYLYGKVASLGYNFYLPENFQIVYSSLELPFSDSELTDFIESVVGVGFPYPPPTIFYVLPLGFLSYESALVVWTIFVLIFLIGCIYLVYDYFFKKDKLNGLVLVSILFLIFPSVKFNIACAQTNFILLFYLLLMKKYADHKISGLILALAFFTKPFMLIFGLFFFLTKNWKAIASFVVSVLIISGISILVVGAETFVSYFIDNPAQRLPVWQFSEDVNQSLNAVLLRANLISLERPHVYLIISAALLTVTYFFSVYLIKRKLGEIVWSLLLLMGLLIYPGTLSYYAVLLLFISFQLFKKEQSLGMDAYLVIPIIGFLYYLNSISVFASICFLLFIVILKSLWLLKKYNLSIDHVNPL